MQLNDVGLTKQEIMNMADQYMLYTFPVLPIVATKAKDLYIYDSDGNAYLDFYAGVAVLNCGQTNERVTKAVQQQAGELTQNCNYFYNIPAALLAKTLCESIGMDKIVYQNSGSEANEAMIKMARKFGVDNYGPDKYEIITAYKSFHGRTYAALTATGQPGTHLHKGFDPLVPGFKYAEFNSLKSFEDAVTDNTIAIMVEPLQAEGGIYPATQEFLQGLRRLCDEKGLLLLLDEVQTGLGRTGTLMCYMDYGIKPDIVSLAKAIGNGVPLGAICCTKQAAAAFTYASHGTTFAGNALSCAAGYAAVSEIIERELSKNAADVGGYMMEKLLSMPHAKIRGKGLLIGIEFDQPVAAQIKQTCFENKLIVCQLGANIIRLVPPLTVTKEDCDTAYDILKKSVDLVYANR
jgi:acetylornithine/N-succinyldiaminopimelate aminotransferase